MNMNIILQAQSIRIIFESLRTPNSPMKIPLKLKIAYVICNESIISLPSIHIFLFKSPLTVSTFQDFRVIFYENSKFIAYKNIYIQHQILNIQIIFI